MAEFKVSLVAYDGYDIPEWIYNELTRNEIRLVAHECPTHEELVQYAGDADLVWVRSGSRIVTAESLADLPRCGAILRSGTGTDNVPVAEATGRGIVVANTPLANADQVADHTIGLLLSVIRQIPRHDRNVRAGIWDRYQGYPNWHLRDQTLGFIGFGMIARMVARKISGFEMKFLAYDPYLSPEMFAQNGAQAVGLDELLSNSDFISILCPLLDGTFHLIAERELRLMRPDAVLINTSRGAVIDEGALIRALREGWIAAAGLDVFEEEPINPDNPLIELNNVVLTDHIASYSDQYLDKTWRYSVETIIDLRQGKWPRSVVNRNLKPRWMLTDGRQA